MIVNPKAKRVLIYGDSLVFGKVSGENRRLGVTERFSGVTQSLLGDEYEIIEEGLRGRTLEGENTFFPDRDGLLQFSPILGSHLPLDLVVIFLGTNECNSGNNKTAIETAKCLREYLIKIDEWTDFLAVSKPKVLVVAPPSIEEASYDDGARKIFGAGAAARLAELGAALKDIANELGLSFIDGSQIVKPSSGDGIHLDVEANRRFAEELSKTIKDLVD